MKRQILFIALILSSRLAVAACGVELEPFKSRAKLTPKVSARSIQSEIRLLKSSKTFQVVASNSTYEVILSAGIADQLSFITLREKASGKIVAQSDFRERSGWTAKADDYVFSADGSRLMLGGQGRMDVIKIPSLDQESALHPPVEAYIYASKAWSENLDRLFLTAKPIPAYAKGTGLSIQMFSLGTKPREIWASDKDEVVGDLVWNEKLKTLRWKTVSGQSWIFDEKNCAQITSEPAPAQPKAPAKVEPKVIPKTASTESDEGWHASRFEKEPGLENYVVTVSRDKNWEKIHFQRVGEKFVNIKRLPGDPRAELVIKNYWYSGVAKTVEHSKGIHFFQTPTSKPINLIAKINEPMQEPRWVVMAESKEAFVARRLDAYGDGNRFYFSKKRGSKGRHLYLAFGLPVDPKLRYELRLNSVLYATQLETYDLKTGKFLASGLIPVSSSRRTAAISADGEKLIVFAGPLFFVIKLNKGKKIDVPSPNSFIEEGLPVNIAGAAFTNDGQAILVSESGTVRIYKQ